MLINRAGPASVALETTLLLHGVPKAQGAPLARELAQIIRDHGANPALIAVLQGNPTVGLTDEELTLLLNTRDVPKTNTANLGVILARKLHGATTVSTTMELASAAGISVFATGGLGGVHQDYATHLDISSDLAAFTRFPIAVVTSGVKSILDVPATREALESLGIPVIGYQTARFPAFYLRESDASVDARFDTIPELASFIAYELARTGRGIVVANPIPASSELPRANWDRWLKSALAAAAAQGIAGRATTPFLLSHLHHVSEGATLKANLDLVRNNAALAAQIATAMPRRT